MTNILHEVLTFSEAAELMGFYNGSTLRKAVSRGRFYPDEYRHSGKVWLIKKSALKRVYKEAITW